MTAVSRRPGLANALLAEDSSDEVLAAFDAIDWTAAPRFGWRFWMVAYGPAGVSLVSPYRHNRALDLAGLVDESREGFAQTLSSLDEADDPFALRDKIAWPAMCDKDPEHVSTPAPRCSCGHYIVGSLPVLLEVVDRSARAWRVFGVDPGAIPWVIGRVMSLGRTAEAPPVDEVTTFRATSYVASGPLFLSPGLCRIKGAPAAVASTFDCPVIRTRARSYDTWRREVLASYRRSEHSRGEGVADNSGT